MANDIAHVSFPQGNEVLLWGTKCEELSSTNIQVSSPDQIGAIRQHVLSGSMPNMGATFVLSMATSALYSAAPQFLKDLLVQQGIGQKCAEYVGKGINVALILYLGSYKSSAAAFITRGIFEYVFGFKSETSTVPAIAGNVAAVAVSTLEKLTPWNLASTLLTTSVSMVGGLLGSTIGFWAENKVTRCLGWKPETTDDVNEAPNSSS